VEDGTNYSTLRQQYGGINRSGKKMHLKLPIMKHNAMHYIMLL